MDVFALINSILQKSESMNNSFSRTKFFVPTQSHPSAPNKLPFETAAGLLAATIDIVKGPFQKVSG